MDARRSVRLEGGHSASMKSFLAALLQLLLLLPPLQQLDELQHAL
jgi:hypothetical protein